MKMNSKRAYMREIYAREEMCEEAFVTWVSEQGVEGIRNTLGELLWWLDGIASCRWGCRGGDHEEQYLLGRTSASASAALLLLRSGYTDQASGVFRGLAETANLLYLFTLSGKEHRIWRGSDERARKDRYSAFNVRLKLEKLNVDPFIGNELYQLLSKYGAHPGPGAEPRQHDSTEDPRVGMPYRPAVNLSFVVAVGNALVRALLFASDLVPHHNVRLDALNAAVAATEQLRGIDLEALKQDSDLVLQPHSIGMIVEP